MRSAASGTPTIATCRRSSASRRSDQPRLAVVVLVDEPVARWQLGRRTVFARASDRCATSAYRRDVRATPVPGPVNPFAVTPPKTCVVPAPKPPRVVAGKPAPPAAIAVPPLPLPLEEPIEVPLGGTIIPDFRGMGLRRALDTARASELGIEIIGSGRVVGQDPAPGPAAASRVTLRFSDGDSPSPPSPPVAP
jgi:hypothetical protein